MSVVAKGLEGIVANESKLSHVEGADGKLSYLGYTIDDLVGNATFEEVIHLLHRGKLPTQGELDTLTETLRALAARWSDRVSQIGAQRCRPYGCAAHGRVDVRLV